jgi:outer membrane protein assembly factor BamA
MFRIRVLDQATPVERAESDLVRSQVEVKSLRVKPQDPLAAPKPVTLEGEVSEGPQYRLGQLTFLKNHAFTTEELRKQFPLKNGSLIERNKIAMGLESLRKLYVNDGYLDLVFVPETLLSSNGIANLSITIDEGPQYHMGKLDIVAEKEPGGRPAQSGS